MNKRQQVITGVILTARQPCRRPSCYTSNLTNAD